MGKRQKNMVIKMIKIGKFNIRPEVDEPLYWVHLVIIVLIVYWLVNTFVQPMEITLQNVFLGALFVGIADVTAHTILKLD